VVSGAQAAAPGVDGDHRLLVDALELVGLFYDSPEQLARFQHVGEAETPTAYRALLAHEDHMTVAVEDWHRSPVNLRVLSTRITRSHYSRKILLLRRKDGAAVQFGIVRLNFDYLSRPIRQEIQAHQVPLGRILIQHNVMRNVELVALWKVTAGAELSRLFGEKDQVSTYGRTAIIHCNGKAAIEVLEIVAPAE
jgi:chorismate-pyruvate lyase